MKMIFFKLEQVKRLLKREREIERKFLSTTTKIKLCLKEVGKTND